MLLLLLSKTRPCGVQPGGEGLITASVAIRHTTTPHSTAQHSTAQAEHILSAAVSQMYWAVGSCCLSSIVHPPGCPPNVLCAAAWFLHVQSLLVIAMVGACSALNTNIVCLVPLQCCCCYCAHRGRSRPAHTKHWQQQQQWRRWQPCSRQQQQQWQQQ